MKTRKKHTSKLEYVFYIAVSIMLICVYIDFLRFPECYLTTWKYQLHNEIIAGNTQSIEYYNNTYIKYDRKLFDEKEF